MNEVGNVVYREAAGPRLYSWEKRGRSQYHLCLADGVPVCGHQYAQTREEAEYTTVNENTLGRGRKAVCMKCVDEAVNGFIQQKV